jgi:lysozyme
MNRDRSISDAGVELIKSFEGLRLQAYQDSVGIWTIGYGSTRGVREGDLISNEQADARLREDLEAAQTCVRSAVHMVRLTQHQFDALVSFVFNLGCRAFRNSTMMRKLEIGDFAAAADQFQYWTRAGLDHPAGLIKRRDAEAAWFRTPD